jgi:excisionase family DNA binding protein
MQLDQPERRDITGLRSAAQAAQFLNVSERHVWKMKAAGDLPFVQLGRRVLFTEADLIDAIMKARVAS